MMENSNGIAWLCMVFRFLHCQKNYMVFSQTKSSEVTHVYWLRAEWGVHTAAELAGSEASKKLHMHSLFQKAMLLFIGVFRVEKRHSEMEFSLGLCAWGICRWGGRKDGMSAPADWVITRAGWLQKSWCLEETCLVYTFLPSKRWDRTSESTTCHQPHVFANCWPVSWLRHCSTCQQAYSFLPPLSLSNFMA